MAASVIKINDSLEGSPSVSLQFPSNLDQTKAFYIIVKKSLKLGDDLDKITDNLESKFDNLSEVFKTNYAKSETLETIALPIPNQLNEVYSHVWEPATGLAKWAETKINSMTRGKLDTAKQALSMGADSLNAAKPMIDPNYYQDYQGTRPRNFDFQFELVPNNMDEVEKIYKIVRHLKMYASPQVGTQGAWMMAPNYFKIGVSNPAVNRLINFQHCVLQNISVNYAPAGTIETTGDGNLKALTLSLTFQEKRALLDIDFGA